MVYGSNLRRALLGVALLIGCSTSLQASSGGAIAGGILGGLIVGSALTHAAPADPNEYDYGYSCGPGCYQRYYSPFLDDPYAYPYYYY